MQYAKQQETEFGKYMHSVSIHIPTTFIELGSIKTANKSKLRIGHKSNPNNAPPF
jgi:hypothetical protein